MSLSTSARLSRGQFVVAIAGATGQLGTTISETFLSHTYKPFFSSVICLTRNPSSDVSKSLGEKGGVLRQIDLQSESTSEADATKALEEVDVLVSALGIKSVEATDKLAKAAVKAGVKLYFPSEFGADHRLNDFRGFDHEEWTHKKEHIKHAKEFSGDKMKIVSVYNGMLLEDTIGPWLGFDTKAGTYTCIGSRTARFALTSKADIARALIELSLLSLSSSASTSAHVSEHVRIAGSVASVEEIAKAVEGESGRKMEVKEVELGGFREKVMEEYGRGEVKNASSHIRILIAEGKMDFSQKNDNELVNPGQRNWKWKTMDDYIKEVKGEPCYDLLNGERKHHSVQ